MGESKFFICIFGAMLITFSACVAVGTGNSGPGYEDSAVGRSTEHGLLLPVSLTITGGFEGRNVALDITIGGLATRTDLRRQESREIQLSADQLNQLQVLLAECQDVKKAERMPRIPGRCRDCIEYRLRLGSKEKPQQINVSSDRLSGSPYRELINMLLVISKDAE